MGQPTVSWGAVGAPKLSVFWNGAAEPCGPSMLAQSGSATVMPYGDHGRPQWKLPPKYSKVIQCMCPSMNPPTCPNGSAPFDGVPVASSSASGNVAQPSAGAKRTVIDFERSDAGDSLNVSPTAGSTRQSAAGLGAAAGASGASVPTARNCLAGV